MRNIFILSNDYGAHIRHGSFLIVSLSIVGFLFSITQIFGISPDFYDYDDYFELARIEGLETIYISRFEPGFTILAVFLTAVIGNNLLVYGLFVAAAMWIKGLVFGIFSASRMIFLAVALFYLIRYFPLHELTQLRVACATTLILVAATDLWSGKYVAAFIFCLLSLTFHVSTAVIIPILLIRPDKRWEAIFAALFAFFVAILFAELLVNYFANLLSIVEAYLILGFGELSPNPLSISLLIDLSLVAISLVIWERLSLLMRRVVLLQLVGLAFFYGMMDFPVVAHRVRELFSVFWVLYVAEGLNKKGVVRLSSIAFVLVCSVFYATVYFVPGTFFR